MSGTQVGFGPGAPLPPMEGTGSGSVGSGGAGSGKGGKFMGENLFIAARPDRGAAAAAQSIGRDYRDLYRVDCQPLSDRRLHVSLIGLEQASILNRSLVYDARAAIDSVCFEPFEIRFDSVMSIRSRASRPIALLATERNPALHSVVMRVADKLDALGILASGFKEDFLVHMTLIYYDKPVMPEHLSKPVSWMVDRLWLARSLVGQGTHEFLWPPDKLPGA